MITAFKHTNLVQSLWNYSCGPSGSRFEKQIRAFSQSEPSADGERIRRQSRRHKCCSYIQQHACSQERKHQRRGISRTGRSPAHKTSGSQREWRNALGGKRLRRKKKVWFLSHSITQRRQICLESSQALRSERESSGENGARWLAGAGEKLTAFPAIPVYPW